MTFDEIDLFENADRKTVTESTFDLSDSDIELKKSLDLLFEKYNTPDFIPNDPVKFVHRYSDDRDREVAGMIASIMAQGRRTNILSSLEKIFRQMEDRPYKFVANFDPKRDLERFKGFSHFAYRMILGDDVACVIYLLKQVIEKYGSIKELFLRGLDLSDGTIRPALTRFVQNIYNLDPLPETDEIPQRVKALIPSPGGGSACKRLNMYLRWMVRSDSVDIGLWREVPTRMLVIPLDVHVSRLSRKFKLTERKSNDWKTAEDITDSLRKFDKDDPVKYDFAIFGLGVSAKEPSVT